MAQTTRLGELAGGLVTVITGKTQDDPSFLKLKEQTAKGLRDASHARTNQFAVKDSYNGLIEKFGARNRDDLADALDSRLKELSMGPKWMPEILSLFLHLSNKPVEKTDISSLGRLLEPVVAAPDLTWQDILADDPLNEEGVWNDVDRGYHSSGDDPGLEDDLDSEPTISNQATSLDEENFVVMARQHLIQPSWAALEDARAAKTALSAHDLREKVLYVTELALIRESFIVVLGLPTHIYDQDPKTGRVQTKNVALATVENATVKAFATQVAVISAKLNALRKWSQSEQTIAFLQAVQDCVQTQFSDFATKLGDVEQRYIRRSDRGVVSMIEMERDLQELAAPLCRLSDIVGAALRSSSDRMPFELLNALYDEACIAHMSGQGALFDATGLALCAGLNAGLRPMQAWMSDGSLPSKNAENFFVYEVDRDCDPGQRWHKRYAMRKLPDGQPFVPKCITSFASEVFSAGKATAFLRDLDSSADTDHYVAVPRQAALDFAQMKDVLQSMALQSFEEVLSDHVASALRTQATHSSEQLCTKLLHQHGVLSQLNALAAVHLGHDGSLLQAFSETLFERIETYPQRWQDPFAITELFHSTLGSTIGHDARSIEVTFTGEDSEGSVIRRLGQIEVRFAFAWLTQNITRCKVSATHGRAFALLLQVAYCRSQLQTEFFDVRTSGSAWKRHAAAVQLRSFLVWFCAVVHDHIVTAAHTTHNTMIGRVSNARGIDEMATIWAEYTSSLQTNLLLAPNLAPIRNAVTELLQICEKFAGSWRGIIDQRRAADDAGKLQLQFVRSLAFACSGLHSVGRATGEQSLEVLAERLEWHGG